MRIRNACRRDRRAEDVQQLGGGGDPSALSDHMLCEVTPLTPIQTTVGWVFGAVRPAHDMDAAPVKPEATPGLRPETMQMLLDEVAGARPADRHALIVGGARWHALIACPGRATSPNCACRPAAANLPS